MLAAETLQPLTFSLYLRNALICFNKLGWTVQLHCKFVAVDKDRRFSLEKTINILEGPVYVLMKLQVME